ncbi:MAG TPA: TrmH family RNA methyltransferase [Bacteroidia bacterium]|nr:TrmH family RNA methyltransferase [Bacteroidia bacterium]
MNSGSEAVTKKIIRYVSGLRVPKERHASGYFVAEGFKVVEELLHSDFKIQMIVFEKGREVPEGWSGHSGLMYEASKIEFDKMSSLVTPAGVLAVAGIPEYELPDVSISGRWELVLDGINDPGNLGTIIRTADWFGVTDIICSPDTADCFSPKVVQAAMGSLFRMRIHYTDLKTYINSRKERNATILIASASGSNISFSKFKKGGILVMGSESHGVRADITALGTDVVAISRNAHSKTESLNAAVAAGILLSRLP